MMASFADLIVDAIVKGAERGDFRFIKLILDRVDGPVSKSPAGLVPSVEVGVTEDDLTAITVHLAEITQGG